MQSFNLLLKSNLSKYKRILVTGGAGFIGGSLIRNLIINSNVKIYNLDKIGYASNLDSIKFLLQEKGFEESTRHELLKVDLKNYEQTLDAIRKSNPDLILHLAAESHVDKSIKGPDDFIMSNIIGTYNILKASEKHYKDLDLERKKYFRFHHISTDEVFGSLPNIGFFQENSPYDPRSPYSASKASSDHLVMSWHYTFGLPVIITNCSNNYGPWQYPEKLIPVTILNAFLNKEIPVYGDGLNIRDWLFVDDHTEALITAVTKGRIGQKYCIGGNQEKTNIEIVNYICDYMDKKFPNNSPHRNLITFVEDRLGHDRRYAINPTKIKNELGWVPKYVFEEQLNKTIDWYLKNIDWALNKFAKKG